MLVLSLLACTGSPSDTHPTASPDDTLCGTVQPGDCSDLPTTVVVYKVAEGQSACSECWETGGGSCTDWQAEQMGEYTVNTDGSWFADLPAGEYGAVSNWGCTACTPVTVTEGVCTDVTLTGREPSMADAPNLYLYPRTPTDVWVRVGDPERVVASAPSYPSGGWRTRALPDGRLRTAGEWTDYLYYEYDTDGAPFQRSHGWCASGPAAVATMESAMADYGFTGPEIADFSVYWDELFPDEVAVTVYPQQRALPPLDIAPAPEHLLRVWFYVEAGCAPVQAPALRSVPRTGYHAAEWGVVIGDGLERRAPVWPG